MTLSLCQHLAGAAAGWGRVRLPGNGRRVLGLNLHLGRFRWGTRKNSFPERTIGHGNGNGNGSGPGEVVQSPPLGAALRAMGCSAQVVLGQRWGLVCPRSFPT